MRKKSFQSLFILVIILTFLLSLTGCGEDEDSALHEITDSDSIMASEQSDTKQSSDVKTIIEVTAKYLDGGKSPTISPQDIYKNVVLGGDTSYILVSLQKPEDYKKGHVKGAINIPYGEIYKQSNISKLSKDKKIVTICYTGHTASQAAMLLNQLGYEAYAMKFGMMGWSSNLAPMGTVKFFTKPANFPIDTTPVELAATNELPIINTGKTTTEEIIQTATEKYISAGKSPTISSDDLFKGISDNKSSYTLVSLQKPEDYVKGHIKGAINIPFAQLATEGNLKKLPKNNKIILICYTGHTASFATMFLNQLGYDAYALKFGMMGWSSNQAPMGTVKFFTKLADYEVVTSS